MPITTQPALLWGNGAGGQAQLSAVEVKVLKILRSNYLGIYATATAQNPTELNAATAIFRNVLMVQTDAYTNANKNTDPDITEAEYDEVQLDKKRFYRYEIETMDRSSFVLNEAMEAEVAGGAALAIQAELDAEFIKTAMAAAIARGLKTSPQDTTAGYFVNAKFSYARTQLEIDTMGFDLTDIANSMLSIVDRKMVGTNKPELMVLTTFAAQMRFIKFAQGNGSNEKAYADMINPQLAMIGGLNFWMHPFILNNIAATTSFSKDQSYDFSKLEALVFHTEAIAMPFSLRLGTQLTGQNSGNPRWIFKFRYGVKVLTAREKLISAILNAAPVARKGRTNELEAENAPDKEVNSNLVAQAAPRTAPRTTTR